MGLKQYSYSEGDAAWWATFLARCERQSKGMNAISLTNFATSTVCAIASGSVVEIDGAIFIASAETSVTGSIATGLNYIICSVTGTTANPYWSQTEASTYDTAKQGFYTAAERYVAGCSSNGTTYNNKWVYEEGQGAGEHTQALSGERFGIKKLEIGNWDMSATATMVVAHGLDDHNKIRAVNTIIRHDVSGLTYQLEKVNHLTGAMVGGLNVITTTEIIISRTDSEGFDSSAFDTSTGYNRGWITMWYEI